MHKRTDCCIDRSGTLDAGSCNVRGIGGWGGFGNASTHTTSATNPGSQYAASCHGKRGGGDGPGQAAPTTVRLRLRLRLLTSKIMTSPLTPFNDCGAWGHSARAVSGQATSYKVVCLTPRGGEEEECEARLCKTKRAHAL